MDVAGFAEDGYGQVRQVLQQLVDEGLESGAGVSVTPKGFPATALWEFRLASLGVQAVLWAGFGLLFGHLAERVLEAERARGQVSALVT
jgi:hypothetical protein